MTKVFLSIDQIRKLRSMAQRISPTNTDISSPADKILNIACGVQGQEINAGLLAIRTRHSIQNITEIENLAWQSGTLIRTWCMRGTIHILTAQDAAWLIPLLAPTFIHSGSRRLKELSWNTEGVQRGLQLIYDELMHKGNLTRANIVSILKENHLPFEGQAPVHLIFRAAYEQILCGLAIREQRYTYYPYEKFICKSLEIQRDDALQKLVNRYLKGFGPATPEDMAYWSGLKISEVRNAWMKARDQFISVQSDLGELWVVPEHVEWIEQLEYLPAAVRLLGAFDNYLLGYVNRNVAIAPEHENRLYKGGGIISPTLVVDGKILGLWKLSKKARKREITVSPFENLPDFVRSQIETEAKSIATFLDETTPFQVVIDRSN